MFEVQKGKGMLNEADDALIFTEVWLDMGSPDLGSDGGMARLLTLFNN